MVAEGVRAGSSSVPGTRTNLDPTIVQALAAQTGEKVSRGTVPDYRVSVPACQRRQHRAAGCSLQCMLVHEHLDECEQRNGVAPNFLLRDHGVSK